MRIAVLLLITGQAWAVQATCELTLVAPDPVFNTLEVTVDPLPIQGFDLPASTDTCPINGTMDAALNVDTTTHQTSEFTLSNGVINADDGNPLLDDLTFGGTVASGFTTVTYSLAVNDLSTEVFTITPPGPMSNMALGEFDGFLHSFNVVQGSLDGDITVTNLFLVPPTTVTPINRSVSPEEPIEGNGSGTGTVTLAHTGSTPGFENYDVTMVLPISSMRTYQDDEGTDSFTVTTSTTIKATGTLQVPTGGFDAWATAQGIPGADPADDYNGDGVKNVFSWAFDLNKEDDARPYLPVPQASGGFQVTLPGGGTVAPIRIRVSTDLSGWSDLPAGRITGGQNPLPSGSTGTFTITPSGADKEFAILEAND